MNHGFLERLVAAINGITTQVWAFFILVTGVVAVILFHREGIAIDIAAGIIGAGVNMFTGQAKGTIPTPPGQPADFPIQPGQPSNPATKN